MELRILIRKGKVFKLPGNHHQPSSENKANFPILSRLDSSDEELKMKFETVKKNSTHK